MTITKKTTDKTIAKKKPAAGKTTKAMKGDQYSCDICGLVVSVDSICGCVATCNILCCGKPMKHNKKTTRKN
jgi:hypothetical protein